MTALNTGTFEAWLEQGLGSKEDPVPLAAASANLSALVGLIRESSGLIWIGSADGPVALTCADAVEARL